MSSVCPFARMSVTLHCVSHGRFTGLKVVSACSYPASPYLSAQTLLYRLATKRTMKTNQRIREREFFETHKTTFIAHFFLLRICGFCSSRLSGLFRCAHKLHPAESHCVPAIRRPKLVTETGLVVRQ